MCFLQSLFCIGNIPNVYKVSLTVKNSIGVIMQCHYDFSEWSNQYDNVLLSTLL